MALVAHDGPAIATLAGIVLMHWFPQLVALIVPLYDVIGLGRLRRKGPTLGACTSQYVTGLGHSMRTYGASANGMPRKEFVPIVTLDTPTTVALSSWTVGHAAWVWPVLAAGAANE